MIQIIRIFFWLLLVALTTIGAPVKDQMGNVQIVYHVGDIVEHAYNTDAWNNPPKVVPRIPTLPQVPLNSATVIVQKSKTNSTSVSIETKSGDLNNLHHRLALETTIRSSMTFPTSSQTTTNSPHNKEIAQQTNLGVTERSLQSFLAMLDETRLAAEQQKTLTTQAAGLPHQQPSAINLPQTIPQQQQQAHLQPPTQSLPTHLQQTNQHQQAHLQQPNQPHQSVNLQQTNQPSSQQQQPSAIHLQQAIQLQQAANQHQQQPPAIHLQQANQQQSQQQHLQQVNQQQHLQKPNQQQPAAAAALHLQQANQQQQHLQKVNQQQPAATHLQQPNPVQTLATQDWAVYDDLDTQESNQTAVIASNQKFGYVVHGNNYKRFRVEEKAANGLITGQFGVQHNNGRFRGVQYVADPANVNPKVLYDALVKFLSLK